MRRSMRVMHQVARIFGAILLLIWAGYAFNIFLLCPWLSKEDRVGDVSSFWDTTRHWSILTLGVLFYVIFMATASHRQKGDSPESHIDRTNRRVILLGLLGGFAIALPALAITILAFATAFPHFMQALKGSVSDSGRPQVVLRSSATDALM